jgi:hypothetical protein
MKLELALASGTVHHGPTPKTIVAAIEDYTAFLKTEGRARKTLVKYEGTFKVFVAFLTENRVSKLTQITTTWFDKFRAFRAKDPHGPRWRLHVTFTSALF